MGNLKIRLLVMAGGCALGFLLMETALRITNVWIGRHSDMMFTVIDYDRHIGWKMKPGIQEAIDLVDVQSILVRSNSLGFWDREFEIPKSPGRRRFAFLGDSFTWGMGVREQERFSNRVTADNPQWESLNFGMPGYGTDQSLLVWQHVVVRYKPDLVILTIYQNDFMDNLHSIRYGRRKPYFELNGGDDPQLKNTHVDGSNFWDDGIYNQLAPSYASLSRNPIERRSRIVHWLAKNSDVIRMTYTMYRMMGRQDSAENRQANQGSAARESAMRAREESPPTAMQHLEVSLMTSLISRLAHEIRATGAQFAVVMAGSPGNEFSKLKESLQRVDVRCLDVTTPVLANMLPQGLEVYFPYNQHWTAAAHQAVSTLLSRWIREEGLLSRE